MSKQWTSNLLEGWGRRISVKPSLHAVMGSLLEVCHQSG